MRIGIDATNIGGGGGITHLKEFLNQLASDTFLKNYYKVVVFGSEKVLDQCPNNIIIVKWTHPLLNKGLLERVFFQLFHFDKEIKKSCDILFSITGDYIGKFKPVVSMSRNMLLYERDIWKEIKQPKEIIRFWLNFQKQKRAFHNSAGVIFISNYAKKIVSKQINLKGKQVSVIHHGISPRFYGAIQQQNSICDYSLTKPFRLLYVSTVHVYKHQWNLIESVGILRKKGYPIELDLVGGIIFKAAGLRLNKKLQQVDPDQEFIHYHGHIRYDKIEQYSKNTDGIIFASTCENMPNTLIESMASGVPIACSNKMPMPEFLKNNGFYFNSYDVDSITNAIEELLQNTQKRKVMAQNNLEEVKQYNWAKTTRQTLDFIEKIHKEYYNV